MIHCDWCGLSLDRKNATFIVLRDGTVLETHTRVCADECEDQLDEVCR